MNHIKNSLLLAASALIIFSCNTERNTEEKSTDESENIETKQVERKSADNLDSLNSILLKSLRAKDKYLYMSYCFTKEQEERVAQLLTVAKQKKYFQREFGFSLHEEVAYFENIIKYIEKTGIDLNKIDNSIIESFDYNRANYSPIILKEVLIPIIQEGFERDVVYVAIQIDNKWYFTSELSL